MYICYKIVSSAVLAILKSSFGIILSICFEYGKWKAKLWLKRLCFYKSKYALALKKIFWKYSIAKSAEKSFLLILSELYTLKSPNLPHTTSKKILVSRQCEHDFCTVQLKKDYFWFCWFWCICHSKWFILGKSRFDFPSTLIEILLHLNCRICVHDRKDSSGGMWKSRIIRDLKCLIWLCRE